MSGEQIWGVIRTIAAAAGGWIVAKGWIDDTTFQQILGAVGVIFVAVWSMWSKKVK